MLSYPGWVGPGSLPLVCIGNANLLNAGQRAHQVGACMHRRGTCTTPPDGEKKLAWVQLFAQGPVKLPALLLLD